jgi:hypothetical protein
MEAHDGRSMNRIAVAPPRGADAAVRIARVARVLVSVVVVPVVGLLIELAILITPGCGPPS